MAASWRGGSWARQRAGAAVSRARRWPGTEASGRGGEPGAAADLLLVVVLDVHVDRFLPSRAATRRARRRASERGGGRARRRPFSWWSSLSCMSTAASLPVRRRAGGPPPGSGRRRFSHFFSFFLVPCGRYNTTAQDNRLSCTVEPPARENADFPKHPVTDGPDYRTG